MIGIEEEYKSATAISGMNKDFNAVLFANKYGGKNVSPFEPMSLHVVD